MVLDKRYVICQETNLLSLSSTKKVKNNLSLCAQEELLKEELPDDNKSLWLSSGNASFSSCFEDDRLSVFLDLPLDTWFISLLSMSIKSAPFLGNAITFFDGSRVNPIEEASLVLDQKLSSDEDMILKENLKEEEVVSWLVTSIDEEDSEWISDSHSELEYFASEFPSKSFRFSEIQSSNSTASSVTEVGGEKLPFSSSSSSDYASEVVDLEDFNTDKPLFWPSDWSPDWGSEGKWDFFVMSPRKNNHEVEFPERRSPESLRLRVLSGKMDLEKGCKRRLIFGKESKSSAGVKEVRRISTIPLWLRKSTKTCVQIVPLDVEDDMREPAEEVVLTEKSGGMRKTMLVEEFESNEELPIETLLGLDEFDGHEGVDSEFNKDEFSLDESL